MNITDIKKSFLLAFSLLLSFSYSQTITPSCGIYYAISGNSVFACSTDIPNTSTLLPLTLPSGANGIAIGPAFGFNAPNPTFWTTAGGDFWYYNGTQFVTTNHGYGLGFGPAHIGGSSNFIYNYFPITGSMFVYSGVGTATLVSFIPFINTGPADVAADNNNNFYLLRLQNPQSLQVYSSQGIQLCTYSVTGIPNGGGGTSMAIIDNTVTVQNNSGYYVGTISGGVVNFTQTSRSYPNPSDFASCPRPVLITPTLSAAPANSITCNNSTLTISASVSVVNGNITYNWSGPGIISPNNASSIQVNAPGFYTCAIISCEGGTVNSSINIFNGVVTPTVLITSFTNTVCSGEQLTLTGTGADTYTWLPGNTTGSAITVSLFSNVTYTLIGETFGCQDTDSIQFFVNPSPTITASSSPSVLCSGGSATLFANSSSSFTWMPGSLQGSVVTVTPLSTNIYSAIASLGNCSAVATTTVFNPSTPTVISSGNALSCTHATAQLVVYPGSANDTIAWFGPGITPPYSSTVLATPLAGTYSLIVTNTLTNCVSIDTIAISGQITPVILNPVSSGTQICYPGGQAINIQINTPAFCVWQPTTDINTSTGPYVSVSPSVTTIYTVTGTLGVCSASTAITISVNPKPFVLAGASSYTACSGSAITLSASGANNYTWQPVNFAGNTLTVTASSNAIYRVKGELNGCFGADSAEIKVRNSPQLLPTAWPVLTCAFNNATLSAADASSYEWQPGSLSGPSVVVNPSVTTAYTVTGNNSSGCLTSSVVVVTVNQGPSISAFASSSLICIGDSVVLEASGATSFTWLPANFTGNFFIDKPTASIRYTAIASNTSCISSVVINVDVLDCSKAALGISNAVTRPQLDQSDVFEIHFSVTAVNAGDRLLNGISLTNDLKTTFVAPGSFTVSSAPRVISKRGELKANTLYDGITDVNLLAGNNSLSSNSGDTIVFSVKYEPRGYYGRLYNYVIGEGFLPSGGSVRDSSNNGFSWDPDLDGDPTNNNELTPIDIAFINLFIPEGFSPNGDGINDRFEIYGLYGRPVKLTIFNRWGNKVYEKDKYDNSWDGKPNTTGVSIGSGKLPESTYYYIVQFLDGKKEVKTGYVVLSY